MSSSASGGGLPFTYVRIPADGTADVEELDGEALGYADALPDYLARTRFASSGAPAASASSGPQAAQTARVLAAASEGRSETFALVHPSSTNGSRGVYLYVDEVGKLKNAPPNARATELARLQKKRTGRMEPEGWSDGKTRCNGRRAQGFVRAEVLPRKRFDQFRQEPT